MVGVDIYAYTNLCNLQLTSYTLSYERQIEHVQNIAMHAKLKKHFFTIFEYF